MTSFATINAKPSRPVNNDNNHYTHTFYDTIDNIPLEKWPLPVTLLFFTERYINRLGKNTKWLTCIKWNAFAEDP